MNNLKSIQYNIEWCDGKYFPSTDVIDKTKNKISNSIENEFSSKIDNIKTPTDLIAFIAIFKWDLKDKLDYKYYVHFTKQLITYINGIIIEDKMQIYNDVFGKYHQRNPYDKSGETFSKFMSLKDNKIVYYLWGRLLNEPMTLLDMFLKEETEFEFYKN